MIAEIGHFALILALGVAAFQCLVPLIGAQRGNREMIASAVPAAQSQSHRRGGASIVFPIPCELAPARRSAVRRPAGKRIRDVLAIAGKLAAVSV